MNCLNKNALCALFHMKSIVVFRCESTCVLHYVNNISYKYNMTSEFAVKNLLMLK